MVIPAQCRASIQFSAIAFPDPKIRICLKALQFARVQWRLVENITTGHLAGAVL